MLFIFSTIVSFAFSTSKIDDFNSQDEENIETRTNDLWSEKKIYAFIYCGINLFLFFFVVVLGTNDILLNNYLSVDLGENNNSEITRKASIKIGK